MSTIVTRAGKGSPLSNTELDTNFTNLNADKLEANRTNPLAQAVRVAMTAAASGSNGIRVLDNDNLDMGTNNFTLHWEGSLPDWTPASTLNMMLKYDSGAFLGFALQLLTTGVLRLIIGNSASGVNYDSTVSTGLSDGYAAKISVSITRESASSAGSVLFFINGTQLGAAVAITAATPTTCNNSSTFYFSGGAVARTASDTTNAILYNRALSAAEVLSLCVNGPARADLGASQTELSSGAWINTFTTAFDTFSSSGPDSFTASDTAAKTGIRVYVAAPVKTGKNYRIEFTPTFTNATLVSITASTGTGSALGFTPAITSPALVSGQKYIVEVAGPSADRANILFNINTGAGGGSFSITNFSVQQIGITGQWNAENAQSNTGQIFDSSGNGNHALLPAAGATVIPQNLQPAVRWINTWSGTSELQYIGGVNQNIIPDDCYFESIVIVPSGSTLTGFTIGNGSNAAYYSTVSVPVTSGVPIYVALSNRFPDANRKLTITPMGAFTGSLAATVSTRILETA